MAWLGVESVDSEESIGPRVTPGQYMLYYARTAGILSVLAPASHQIIISHWRPCLVLQNLRIIA